MSARGKPRPVPRVGDTEAMRAFVESGTLQSETQGSLPSSRPAGQPDARHDGVTRVTTAAVPSLCSEADADADDMRAIREARRRRAEPEPRTVKTTVRLPESVARRLRIIAISEGVTMTAIAEDVLRAWAARYDGGVE